MPMSGIKVVEACSNIAGPVTGTIFGDLGAEVIKIEKPNGGDDARGWSPPVIHGMGARFQVINRNKLSVTLELKNDKDRDELKRLVAEADVFVHNMRPGVAESLGLSGPEALALKTLAWSIARSAPTDRTDPGGPGAPMTVLPRRYRVRCSAMASPTGSRCLSPTRLSTRAPGCGRQ
jgi:hypothetical protein